LQSVEPKGGLLEHIKLFTMNTFEYENKAVFVATHVGNCLILPLMQDEGGAQPEQNGLVSSDS
jgi:hypothetical protein